MLLNQKSPCVSGLSRPQLKRIINSARRTLFECLKGRHFEPTLEKAFTPPPHTNDIYDFRIELKAFKADPKTLTQTSRNLPVMDFDTVKLYLEELRARLGGHNYCLQKKSYSLSSFDKSNLISNEGSVNLKKKPSEKAPKQTFIV